ncbi:CbrC family protein [Brachybacterium sp. DNPG3]
MSGDRRPAHASAGPRPSPGAREEDVARVEDLIGARLPDLLRMRLLAENGFVLDDTAGATARVWRMLPVLDRSHRKRMTATAQDIARSTAEARAIEQIALDGFGGLVPGTPFPADGTVVGLGAVPHDRLTLLPDPERPGVLGTALHLQRNLNPIVPLGIDLADLAPDPDAVAALSGGTSGDGADAEAEAEELPVFRYHPDPVATGAITRTVLACAVCGRARGWRVAGVDLDPAAGGRRPGAGAGGPGAGGALCPWCLAAGVPEVPGLLVDVDPGASEESARAVVRRTPGFSTWQGTRWLAHCGEAAAYRGTAGWEDVEPLPAARAAIIADGWDPEVLVHLRRDGDLVAYLFRCVRCGEDLAYADAS